VREPGRELEPVKRLRSFEWLNELSASGRTQRTPSSTVLPLQWARRLVEALRHRAKRRDLRTATCGVRELEQKLELAKRAAPVALKADRDEAGSAAVSVMLQEVDQFVALPLVAPR
jgi:hypothetical protein